MDHLLIAYYLIVIVIGFVALSMAGFWAVKTKEVDLRNFCVLYASFTLVLIVSLLLKYLFLNVENYSVQTWYLISGVYQVFNFTVLVAAIHFILGIYRFSSNTNRVITSVFLFMALVCIGLMLSPFGATLDTTTNTIRLGMGYRITIGWYFVSFTFTLILGYGFLKRVWNMDKRNFVIGLLIFATIGYGESLINLPQELSTSVIILSSESGDFLFSSIPYALYGIFLIRYFIQYPIHLSVGADEISADFLSKYGITEREREIIMKVIQGKSNADIAAELVISLATVKTHLHNIYKKAGVDSRYELLARVRSSQ